MLSLITLRSPGLRDAFPDGDGLRAALELHAAESAVQAARVNVPLLALLRETLPLRQPTTALI
jgi:hypothetical protein